MARNNVKYRQDQIEEAVKIAKCYSDVFRNLGLGVNGGSYKWMKKLIDKYEIDISHFLSAAQLGNMQYRINMVVRDINTDDISTDSRLSANRLQNFMFSKGKNHQCNICGLSSWMDSPIRLDIDHIDNNPINNHINNLQFICPNCHRQKTIKYVPTSSELFKMTTSKKMKDDVKFVTTRKIVRIDNHCIDCDKIITNKATKCKSCSSIGKTRIDWPDDEILKKSVWDKPMFTLAKEWNCSDVAIAKRCKLKGFDTPYPGYWRKLETGKL
jgi:5-methylcytosine-specific restriction endonuclease McrA